MRKKNAGNESTNAPLAAGLDLPAFASRDAEVSNRFVDGFVACLWIAAQVSKWRNSLEAKALAIVDAFFVNNPLADASNPARLSSPNVCLHCEA